MVGMMYDDEDEDEDEDEDDDDDDDDDKISMLCLGGWLGKCAGRSNKAMFLDKTPNYAF